MKNLKRSLVLLLASLLLFVFACGKTDPPEIKYVYVLKPETELSQITSAALSVMKTEMLVSVDETKLQKLFHIEPSMVSEYNGKYTLSFTSADNFLIVKPTAEAKDDVQFALEQRRQDLIDLFTESIPSESDKAKNSVVLVRGDYLVYICAADVEAVTASLDAFFEQVPEDSLPSGEAEAN